jgi:DNA-binding response OmpR family regulator
MSVIVLQWAHQGGYFVISTKNLSPMRCFMSRLIDSQGPQPLVLVIEDDADISELIQYNLEKNGFKVCLAGNGQQGLEAWKQRSPDIVLLDIMMPIQDGLEVLKAARASKDSRSMTPVILLTAKGEESDVVAGLELGADDYVTKPFSPRELVARINSVLRRTSAPTVATNQKSEGTTLKVGPVAMDFERHQVWLNDVPATFTLAEFNLLKTLVSKPGKVFTRDQLLEKITGGEAYVIDRNVDVHIRAIRKKLNEDADLVETVRGVGYKCKEV